MSDIKKYFEEKYTNIKWNYDVIQYMKFLSLKHIPLELKNIYSKTINDVKLLEFMNDEAEDLFPYFLHFHHQMNKIRKEKFIGNTVLKEFIQDYKNVASPEDFKLRFGSNLHNL